MSPEALAVPCHTPVWLKLILESDFLVSEPGKNGFECSDYSLRIACIVVSDKANGKEDP